MQGSDHEERSRKEREREKKERQEASLREREKEVQRSLGETLRERDKEREQHKREEASQQFKALLVDLVCIHHLCCKEHCAYVSCIRLPLHLVCTPYFQHHV